MYNDKPFSLENYGIRQGGNVEVQDALSTLVRRKFDAAVMHKRTIGIEAQLLRNLRANRCEYQPDERALLGPFNDVYIGISALKARAAESWLTDIILNNIDKPWILDPTPEPDLRESEKEDVVTRLLNELPDLHSVEALKDRARELKGAQQEQASAKAEDATGRMETRIADQMAEGDWTAEFAKFIADIVSQPAAIMRGPIVISKAVGSWDGEKYTAKHQQIPTTRTISPFDAYPAPNAISPNDGEYFCERATFSRAKLYSLTKVDGFNAGNIRQVFASHATGYDLDLYGDAERKRLEEKSPDGTVSAVFSHIDDYDTIIFNGLVKGELLAEHGIIVSDIQNSYECEVWLVGDYVIRAILNPNPTGSRPIYATSYRKIAGSFWGQGVIDLTYDQTRMCNAACRALVRNMGYSSGPIGEVVSERVASVQDPTDISPYRVVLVEPDMSGTGAPAYKFHNISSIAPDLMAVIESWMKLADDISGVPSYVLGNPQVAGAGRTLGGLSMLMGNAAKGIKNVQLNIDRDVISGIVTGFYIFNMQTSDDDSIKADCKVVARGATGLLQRELAQTRTVELLQLLTPYLENWEGMPDGIKVLLREVLKTTGLPIDKIIPDPDSAKKAMDLLGMIQGGQSEPMQRGMNGAPPLPPQSIPTPMNSGGPPVPVNMATGA
jgi:hypothetical protein